MVRWEAPLIARLGDSTHLQARMLKRPLGKVFLPIHPWVDRASDVSRASGARGRRRGRKREINICKVIDF